MSGITISKMLRLLSAIPFLTCLLLLGGSQAGGQEDKKQQNKVGDEESPGEKTIRTALQQLKAAREAATNESDKKKLSKAIAALEEVLLPLPDLSKAVAISMKTLTKEYDENTVAADEKYKGRILKVTGIVESVGQAGFYKRDSPFLWLEGRPGIRTELYFRNEKVLIQFKKGDSVTVVGKCEGIPKSGGRLTLTECELIEK